MRFDRVDAFWFTVMHEFSHIAHNDALSVDADVLDAQGGPPAAVNEMEARANREAAERLVPQDALISFIRRVGPYYSRDRIVQFAHSMKIHPGIIVGQLQHRGEIGYGALRALLSKVRDAVTETAVTDGKLVPSGYLKIVQPSEQGVVKEILGVGRSLSGRLLTYDALDGSWEEMAIAKRPDCPTCGHRA